MNIRWECIMSRLTEQDCQTSKKLSGNAGRRMVAPEYGFLHVYAREKCQRLRKLKGKSSRINIRAFRPTSGTIASNVVIKGGIFFITNSLNVPFKMF